VHKRPPKTRLPKLPLEAQEFIDFLAPVQRGGSQMQQSQFDFDSRRLDRNAALHRRPRTALPSSELRVFADAVGTCTWDAYERVIIAFSGGKDSLACLLRLLDLGVPKEKLELWHHDIDGREGAQLMDWPVTRDYCRAVAKHFDIPIRYSWKVGGFEREMLRDNAPTAPTRYELPDGTLGQSGGKGKPGTRLRFPQVTADLKTRWCSAYLKIDVCATALRNDLRLRNGRSIVVTGERREESRGRSRYMEVETHRASSSKRNIHHWRPVIDMGEPEVWELIKKYGITPHPAYRLGFGRVSCLACIFGNPDQWAAVAQLDPVRFERIAAYEQLFGCTIHRKKSVRELAGAGVSLVADKPESLRNMAMSHRFVDAIHNPVWHLPQGAYRACGGPT
jgi:3'-phosphoadenosine 5'-phosphosulfate sulfotransferase (PAPS reductase)/FAD synthetase